MKQAILDFYRGTDTAEYPYWQEASERASIGKKVDVVWGAHNPGNGAETALRSYPDASVSIYENSGHWPMPEEEARWLDKLQQFVEST